MSDKYPKESTTWRSELSAAFAKENAESIVLRAQAEAKHQQEREAKRLIGRARLMYPRREDSNE